MSKNKLKLKMIDICKNCGLNKKHYAKGLCSSCYHKDYYLYHQDKIKQDSKNRNLNNPDYNKNWKLDHPDKVKQHDKEFKLNHPNYHKKYYKDRYDNPIGEPKMYKRSDGKLEWRYPSGKRVHDVIAEKSLSRRLKKGEGIHHLDGNPLNNEHSNLIICDNSYHRWLDWKQKKLPKDHPYYLGVKD